jgi:hypothetical protein
VVIGKMMAVMAFVSLLFGATLPFLAFAYVLRGLDLWPCVLAVFIALLVIMSEAAFALFVGALPLSRPFKILLALLLFAFLIVVSRFTIFGNGSPLGAVFSGSGAGLNLRVIVITTVLTFVIIDVVFMVLTTAILTPAPANRALPIRAMLSILWIVTLGVAIRVSSVTKISGPMEVWAWMQIFMIALVLLSAVGEREEWGWRVARTIPRLSTLRALAFLFYSGAAGGVLWTTMMFVATLFAFLITGNVIVMHDVNVSVYGYEPFDAAAGTMHLASACVAIVAYGLTAVFIHRRLLARRVPQRNTWAIVAIMLIVFAVLLPLAATLRFVETNHFQKVFDWSITANPFAKIEDPQMAASRFVILIVWFTLAVAANGKWMDAQWRRFKRAETIPHPAGACPERSRRSHPLPSGEETEGSRVARGLQSLLPSGDGARNADEGSI